MGKTSDRIGRKPVLIATVIGTASPVIALALVSLCSSTPPVATEDDDNGGDHHAMPSTVTVFALRLFIILFGVSGLFACTFTLTFSYISDCVTTSADRIAGYGLALATFGLSFTIGPMLGGYMADPDEFVERYNRRYYGGDVQEVGQQEVGDGDEAISVVPTTNAAISELTDPGVRRVFAMSLVLIVIDVLYIHFFLPESVALTRPTSTPPPSPILSPKHTLTRVRDFVSVARTNLASLAGLLRSSHTFTHDPFLREIAIITFLYYTSIWAVVSTLVLYVTKVFHFGPGRLGELMSAFGISTVFAEGILVRIVVPAIGEVKTMRLGLIAFAAQSVLIAFATESWMIFGCVFLSTLTNLVYPSITGLVSSAVRPDKIGESLGAINGIKALTEGIGPLCFGVLMQFTEDTKYPGAPYLLSALLAGWALRRTYLLPDLEEYVSEKYEGGVMEMKEGEWGTPMKEERKDAKDISKSSPFRMGGLAWLGMASPSRAAPTALDIMRGVREADDEEMADEALGLLSEIESEGEGN